MGLFDKLLGRSKPAPTLQELVAENQRLQREADAIRERRRELAEKINERIAKGER